MLPRLMYCSNAAL